MPEGTAVSAAESLTLADQDMDNVFWTCMSEETDPQRVEGTKPCDDNVPLAIDIAPVIAEQMIYDNEVSSFINIAWNCTHKKVTIYH